MRLANPGVMWKPLFVALLLGSVTSAQSQAPASIEGQWKNPSGTAIIALTPCGKTYCGKVVWASQRGKREAAKGASKVVGTIVLTGVRRVEDHWNGTLFIPDDDIHVSARLELEGSDRMKLTGCAILGLFCRTQIWTRWKGQLPGS